MPTRIRIDLAGYHHIINRGAKLHPWEWISTLINSKQCCEWCKESILLKRFNIKELIDFFDVKINQKDLNILNAKQKINVKRIDEKVIISEIKVLKILFKNVTTKNERNKAIIKSYNNSHSQVEIAKYLNVSKSLISKIVKSGDSFSGV